MADAEGKKNSRTNFPGNLSQPHYKKVIRRRSSSMLNDDDFQCPICERRLSLEKEIWRSIMEKLHPNGELSEYQKKEEGRTNCDEGAANFQKASRLPLTSDRPHTCLLTSPLTLPSA
ncbi:uncharacterized protein LOC124375188 [Homalodisca vitripennis]|uniref:uncharacterized protein LOC124375188 n=1 Tax=Homalodisca vitripennis TaxID=197043 RepID=UPI001EEA2B6F|nr:uncharacterized protein LOC124375188 [Homalodisca vitripennis]